MAEDDKAQVIQVGTAVVRMTPVGFATFARAFLVGGGAALREEGGGFQPVPYYMHCRALELGLKSFLLLRYTPLDQLKDVYGHHLVRLLEAAVEKGVQEVTGNVGAEFRQDVEMANEYYLGKAFEYFDFTRWAHGYENLPPPDRFEQTVHEFLTTLIPHCISEA